VKSSNVHHQSKATLFGLKKKKKRKLEGEGAPSPEKPSLSHFAYENSTELGPPGQFVTSLDSSGSVRLRTGILRVKTPLGVLRLIRCGIRGQITDLQEVCVCLTRSDLKA